MRVKVYISRDAFIKNGIDSVPTTIIETKDGKTLRFDGLTENFIGNPPETPVEGIEQGGAALAAQAPGGSQPKGQACPGK